MTKNIGINIGDVLTIKSFPTGDMANPTPPGPVYSDPGWLLLTEYRNNTSTDTFPNGWLLTNVYEEESDLDGYVFPNGIDQYATLPFTNIGNTFSMAFAYKEWNWWDGTTLRYNVICSNTNYFQLGSSIYATNQLVFRAGTNSNQAFYSTVGKLSYNASIWHTVAVAVNISANTVKMYFDGVEDFGVASGGGNLADVSYTSLQLFKAGTYFNNMKTKHIVFTSDEMTTTEALEHYNNSISSIDNQIAWYKCNEAYGSEYLLDYSGNGRIAEVFNADETFYNRQET